VAGAAGLFVQVYCAIRKSQNTVAARLSGNDGDYSEAMMSIP
jgi:hypothetical protein